MTWTNGPRAAMRKHVEKACQVMMASLAWCAGEPAGFRDLATTVLAERGAWLLHQATGPSPPWLVLPILTCEALQGESLTPEPPGLGAEHDGHLQAAYYAAAAWELGNAAAAHLDAWQDQDTEGALWQRIGPQRTVNLALGLVALSFHVLSSLRESGILPASVVVDLQSGFTDTLLRMVQGQHDDLCDDMILDGYKAVVVAKAGSLFRLACWSGAVVAGASADVADQYGAFGETLGVLIQAWNDLYGLEGALGKRDRGHRRTLPILAALTLANRGGCQNESPPPDALEQGGRLYAVLQAALLHQQAAEALARCPARGRLPLFLDAYAPEHILVVSKGGEV